MTRSPLTPEEARRLRDERNARKAAEAAASSPAPEPPAPAPSDPPPSAEQPRAEASNSSNGADDDADDGTHEPADAFRFYGEQVWSRGEPPPRKWLLTRRPDPDEPVTEGQAVGFLPMGKVGMMAAAGGAGKTMALLQLAVSVATGRPWLGAHGFEVPEESQGNVCLLLAEEDAEEVQRRLLAIKQGLGMSAGSDEWERVRSRLMILPFAGQSAQFIEAGDDKRRTRETAFFHEFKARLSEYEWKLIVLDPLSRLATAETEVDNHHATRFVSTVEQLVNLPGSPAVLVAHHTSKAARSGATAGTASAARGASGLTDGVRWAATLEDIGKDDPQLHLSLVKHNYNAPAAPRPLVRGAFGVLNVMTPAEETPKPEPTPRPPATRQSAPKRGKAPSDPPAPVDDGEESDEEIARRFGCGK